MSGKRINYLLISILSVTLFIFEIFFIKNMNSSYAYEIKSVSYPSSTFTTNYNGDVINYIKDALKSNGSSSNLSENFNVPNNLKIASSGNILYLLHKNLEIPGASEDFEPSSNNINKINDNGIKYIISHGLNTTNNLNHIFKKTSQYGTATAQEKYYVTQIALWLYLYEKESSLTNICSNNTCKFYTKSSGNTNPKDVRKVINECSSYKGYEYLKYITYLVDNAKTYKGVSDVPNITSSNSGDIEIVVNTENNLFTSSLITPTVSSSNKNFKFYSYEIEDPDKLGVYLTDENGKKLYSSLIYGTDLKFKVNVPLKEDLNNINLNNIRIKLSGVFSLDTMQNEYHVTSSPKNTKNFSNVLFAYAQDYVTDIQFSFSNFVIISNVDAYSLDELSGTSLKIINKSDNSVVEEWISTNKPAYFNLDNGNYKLCKTAASTGYKLEKECIDFSVDNSHVVSLRVENNSYLSVITNKNNIFIKYRKYIFGALLIIIGLVLFITSYRKNINLEEV